MVITHYFLLAFSTKSMHCLHCIYLFLIVNLSSLGTHCIANYPVHFHTDSETDQTAWKCSLLDARHFVGFACAPAHILIQKEKKKEPPHDKTN